MTCRSPYLSAACPRSSPLASSRSCSLGALLARGHRALARRPATTSPPRGEAGRRAGSGQRDRGAVLRRRPRARADHATHIAKLKDSIADDEGQGARSCASTPASGRCSRTPTRARRSRPCVDAGDAVKATRRQQLLDQANQTDNDDRASGWPRSTPQLKNQQADLERQEQRAGPDQRPARREAHGASRPTSTTWSRRSTDAADDASTPRSQSRRCVDAQRKADLEAEKAALQEPQQTISSRRPRPDHHPAQVTARSSARCRARPTATTTAARPATRASTCSCRTGTPAVAVKAGTVRYVPNEGAGGNAAYLDGRDGNTYYYAHFSQFIGEAPHRWPRARSSASPA